MTLLASVMLLASACTGKQASEKTASGLEPANFRTEVDGKQTDLFVLENKNGMEVCITNFGGRIYLRICRCAALALQGVQRAALL